LSVQLTAQFHVRTCTTNQDGTVGDGLEFSASDIHTPVFTVSVGEFLGLPKWVVDAYISPKVMTAGFLAKWMWSDDLLASAAKKINDIPCMNLANRRSSVTAQSVHQSEQTQTVLSKVDHLDSSLAYVAKQEDLTPLARFLQQGDVVRLIDTVVGSKMQSVISLNKKIDLSDKKDLLSVWSSWVDLNSIDGLDTLHVDQVNLLDSKMLNGVLYIDLSLSAGVNNAGASISASLKRFDTLLKIHHPPISTSGTAKVNLDMSATGTVKVGVCSHGLQIGWEDVTVNSLSNLKFMDINIGAFKLGTLEIPDFLHADKLISPVFNEIVEHKEVSDGILNALEHVVPGYDLACMKIA